MSGTLRLHPEDDVVIAKTRLSAGTRVDTDVGPVALGANVPAGHKIAVRARAAGDPVRRYGQIIGFATVPIAAGDHVHQHNLEAGALVQRFEVAVEGGPTRPRPPSAMRTFDGFLRADGRVGTRNYLLVIPTVNCSATVVRMVGDRFRDVARDHPNVDGVVAISHRSGCGLVAQGDDHWVLQRVIAGYANHPNVGATVVVSLGCEVNQPEPIVQLSLSGQPPAAPGERFPIVTVQREGGTRKAVEAAVAEIARLLPRVDAARRVPRPASDLVVATNCGGSDGYSGITANPALGWAMDEVVRHGGTAILAETTEIVGAEQLLVRRARSEEVARKLLDRIAWWKAYLARHGAKVDHNPSPGNIVGGITTVYEKALGGIAKGGTSPLIDVIDYAERISARGGLVFMDTPGFDPVSVTGLVAGGANLICFTTGRGSVFGCKPTPSIKLATSSMLYRHMTEDMDIDCGTILDGASIEEVGGQILDEIFEVASGKRTKSELLGFGSEEFAPWQAGPTL